MAEHDNAWMPVANLFLSTATSIGKQKRRRALKAFLEFGKSKYNTSPRFVHANKELAEIGAVVISILTYSIHDGEVSRWVRRVRILIYTRLSLHNS
jgi:hypothetical protein